MHIKIDHIAKIEGHAGFVADIAGGNVVKARLDVMEGARLLEGILQSRSFEEVSNITARICGVCPTVHILTSLKALENAMGVFPSGQTIMLRELMMMGQIINSHALHLFFFSLSDFYGFKNDLDLIKKYPDKAKDALILREYGNKIIEIIGGRSIHPLTPEVGGFKKLPQIKQLKELSKQSEIALGAALDLSKFFGNLKYPDFKRDCQYVALSAPGQYPIYDGLVRVGKNETKKVSDFIREMKEKQLDDNPAVKRADWRGLPYMVGALARLNYNAKFLNPHAKEIFRHTDLVLPSANPFYNILAQAIEMVHCVEESHKLLVKIEKTGIDYEKHPFEAKAGKGYGAIEAPRGVLLYYYEVSENGLISGVNIVTPTSQNLARLEKDLEEYLPSLTKNGKKVCQEDCKDLIKMLVRAYDPCLTCATH